MGECEVCGKEGSRLQINHKEKGRIMVCRDCWKEIREKGKSLIGRVSSSSGSTGCSLCGS